MGCLTGCRPEDPAAAYHRARPVNRHTQHHRILHADADRATCQWDVDASQRHLPAAEGRAVGGTAGGGQTDRRGLSHGA